MTDTHLALLIAFVALQIADVVTTMIALKKGAQEGNPLLAPLFKKFGAMPVLLASKIVIVASVVTIHQTLTNFALGLGVVVYGAVVLNNLIVLRRMKSG